MCLICRDFDEPESHFCGDAHGLNLSAWCELCLAEVAAFLAPPAEDPNQQVFPFAAPADDPPVYSLRQVSVPSAN